MVRAAGEAKRPGPEARRRLLGGTQTHAGQQGRCWLVTRQDPHARLCREHTLPWGACHQHPHPALAADGAVTRGPQEEQGWPGSRPLPAVTPGTRSEARPTPARGSTPARDHSAGRNPPTASTNAGGHKGQTRRTGRLTPVAPRAPGTPRETWLDSQPNPPTAQIPDGYLKIHSSLEGIETRPLPH